MKTTGEREQCLTAISSSDMAAAIAIVVGEIGGMKMKMEGDWW